jgi:molecular chaperone Hsp33
MIRRALTGRQVAAYGYGYSKQLAAAFRTLSSLRRALSTDSEIADLTRVVTASGGVSIKTLNATALVRQATDLHACSPVAAAALGRVLMGAILLGAGRDHHEVTQIRLQGGGPLGVVCAEAVTDARGQISVRGFVEHPNAEVPPKADGSPDVGAAVGTRGVLRVQRTHPRWKQPYAGVTALVTGEVGDDLAHYLLVSEQVPAAVGVGVTLQNHHRSGRSVVVGAAAFLCAALPGCSDAELAALEAAVRALPKPSALAALTAGDVADSLADDCGAAASGIAGRQRWDEAVVLKCACAEADLAGSVALALDASEVDAARRSGLATEVKCEWCGRRHWVSPSALARIAKPLPT